MRQLKRVVVLALGVILVAACASILDIGEPGFADIEGGLSTDGPITDSPGGVDPDVGDGAKSDASDGGAARCKSGAGFCPGACLDTICSRCPPGTTNLAPSGTGDAYTHDEGYRLNDVKLGSAWLATHAPDQDNPAEVWIGNLGYRTIRRVSVFGLRSLQAMGHDVTDVTISLSGRGSTVASLSVSTDLSTRDVTWDPPQGGVGEVSEVRVRIDHSTGPLAGISEIEICGN
jgi:hypothetical protein